MSIDFRIVEHSVRPGERLVEVLLDGKAVGAVYPKSDGVIIVSAHFLEKEIPEGFDGEVVIDDGKSTFPPIPALQISFKPRRYYFVGKRIVYLE